jgi:hypothetical protein
LNIPTNVANEYLIPKDYVKPEIKVGNYILKWDISSHGIAQREVAELKRFVIDLAPYLSTAVYNAARGIQRSIKEENAAAKEVRRLEEAFLPRLLLTRKIHNKIVYGLEMTGDGATIISRHETITSEGSNNTKLTLSWNLGELVFNRQKVS